MLGLGTSINRGGFVSAGESLLLDEYSGAAVAYSLRKLSSSYSGNCVTVRRDSDNLDANIGFSGGVLDTSALASHCGSANGFVVTWFDQSSNSNNATQTTAANQPKIYDGTTGVVTENGKPAVEFTGHKSGDDELLFTVVSSTTNIAAVAKTNTTNFQYLVGKSPDGALRTRIHGRWAGGSEGDNNDFQRGGSLFVNGSEVVGDGASNPYATSRSLIFANAKSGGTTLDLSIIGGTYNNRHWNGPIQEVILFDTDQSSNRTDIEDNINTFYSIY